jgi:vacuolar-type H+-ATPase subunit C/Vma6
VEWSDLDARARGLATRLLGRKRLEALARAADLDAAAAELARRGLIPLPIGGASPATLEEELRRTAAARLRTLSRWCGERSGALAALHEEESRRSLRALLRGAAAGAPPERRLAGLIPTPELPERALRELARQPTPAAVALLLAAWGSAYGPPLLAEAGRAQPDLLAVETALARAFAARLLRAARQGGKELAARVRETIDLENAAAALLLAGAGGDARAEASFLPGGDRLSREGFLAAAAAPDRSEAALRLARAFRGTPFAAVLTEGPAALEAEILRIRLRTLAAAARRQPLGPSPFLLYLLRLRAELADLRKILWGIALGVPRERLARELVTP